MQGLKSIKELLKDLDLSKRKRYISQEFQAYGLLLAKELKDWENRSLYIKLAKINSRDLLEKARCFVKDQDAKIIKSRARLFMWKLGELKKSGGKQRQKQPPKH
ncbi:MAG: hypothetical protein ABIB61_00365 [Candidatus Shapirobacteria bacterium]